MLLNIIYVVGIALIGVGLGASLRKLPYAGLISAPGAALMALHNALGGYWWLVVVWIGLTAFSVFRFVRTRQQARGAR